LGGKDFYALFFALIVMMPLLLEADFAGCCWLLPDAD
jgi:hypothetical protein